MNSWGKIIENAIRNGACDEAIEVARLGEAVFWAHEKAPEWAYWYAKYVIKGPWPMGEAAISQDAEWAYVYARYVIRGQWTMGEEAISQDAKWVYRYAHDVIQGPWYKGVKVLSQDEKLTYLYALDVLGEKNE